MTTLRCVRRRAAAVVLALFAPACAGRFDAVVAPTSDYADYRLTRVAPTVPERLQAAERYLKLHPGGAFRDAVARWYGRIEPLFFEASSDSLAGAEKYLATLPSGPHANSAEQLRDAFPRSRSGELGGTDRRAGCSVRAASRLRRTSARRRPRGVHGVDRARARFRRLGASTRRSSRTLSVLLARRSQAEMRRRSLQQGAHAPLRARNRRQTRKIRVPAGDRGAPCQRARRRRDHLRPRAFREARGGAPGAPDDPRRPGPRPRPRVGHRAHGRGGPNAAFRARAATAEGRRARR
jgi:hypothetical protein